MRRKLTRWLGIPLLLLALQLRPASAHVDLVIIYCVLKELTIQIIVNHHLAERIVEETEIFSCQLIDIGP